MSYGAGVFDQHAKLLTASAISPEVARQRNYQSVDTRTRLESIDIAKTHRRVPGLLLPVYGPACANGEASTWQYRPDDPRIDAKGKPVKYVTANRDIVMDVPVAVRPHIDNPDRPLWITEGIRKADSAVSHGLDCIDLLGVWMFRGMTAAWDHIQLRHRDVFLCYDADVMVNPKVRKALHRFCGFLEYRGAVVKLVILPDVAGPNTGLDDFLASGHTVDELHDDGRVIWPAELGTFVDGKPKSEPYVPPAPVPLDVALATFRRWLHFDDPAPVLAVAAAVVANLAEGDPVWLLIVGPPSGGKTEILQATARLPYMIPAATISEAALLSGTSRRERAQDATGGLLRQVGEFGILLAKDFTSVLSQNRDTAKQAMAALREVYDGSWHRPVGTDGGRVLSWSGKCGFVGGVTPTYDRYASIVNALGDRFLLLRLPDVDAAAQAVSALDNTEREKAMRDELAEALAGLIGGADGEQVHSNLNDDERNLLVALATFTARTRTGVERDGYSGELLVLPQPEGPARLVKAMRRVYGGLAALGVDCGDRWDILERIAVDCAPAIRLPLIKALLAASEPKRTAELAKTVGMVTKTAHRQLDDLALLGVAERTKSSAADNAPDLWEASAWLREYWPNEVRQRSTTRREGEVNEGDSGSDTDTDDSAASTAPRTSPSHSEPCTDNSHSPRLVDGAWTCPQCREETPA